MRNDAPIEEDPRISPSMHDPETRLWRRVVFFALEEALNMNSDAIEWLFQPQFKEDRKLVNELSGLDVNWIAKKFARLIVKNFTIYEHAA